MRILVISDASPYPLISGDRIRQYNLLRRIARENEVWLATLLDNPSDIEGVPHLASFCVGIEIAPAPRNHPLLHIPGLLRYALEGKPLELMFRHSEDLVRKIRLLISKVDFDLVQILNSHMALYFELFRKHPNIISILALENIEFSQYESIYRIENEPVKKLRAWLNSRMMRRWEPVYAQNFDRCITVSEVDRSILEDANPNLLIDIIPNGVDTKLYQPLSRDQFESGLLFIGKMSYEPCSDGAQYLCREIMPLIREKIEHTDLWIVGRDPPPEVVNLEGNGVFVTGLVDDIMPYYKRCAVCVVPLRAGGGTRLKILEAMALGRPVVSTTIGCEGLNVIDGEHLLIADHAKEFAEKTIQLLTDQNLYQSIVANARLLVENEYDWDALASRLMDIFAKVKLCM